MHVCGSRDMCPYKHRICTCPFLIFYQLCQNIWRWNIVVWREEEGKWGRGGEEIY